MWLSFLVLDIIVIVIIFITFNKVRDQIRDSLKRIESFAMLRTWQGVALWVLTSFAMCIDTIFFCSLFLNILRHTESWKYAVLMNGNSWGSYYFTHKNLHGSQWNVDKTHTICRIFLIIPLFILRNQKMQVRYAKWNSSSCLRIIWPCNGHRR